MTTTGPLAGVRVLELGGLIAGPFCSHLLADYGAEVVKVELPGEGDLMRQWGGRYKGLGLYWPILARNKQAITLDLRRPEGQELFRRLAALADVVVEDFWPGTLERWDLGYETLSAINPALILVRVSGYGQTGPYRDKAGFGAIGEAMGGLRYLTGEPGRPPVRVGVSLGDAMAATMGCIGTLLALYARDGRQGSGRGQVVDVAIYEAVWAYMESILPEWTKLGSVRERTGSVLPGVAPSNVYPSQEGEWILVAANADAVFAAGRRGGPASVGDRPALRHAPGARRAPGAARRPDRPMDEPARRGRDPGPDGRCRRARGPHLYGARHRRRPALRGARHGRGAAPAEPWGGRADAGNHSEAERHAGRAAPARARRW